MVWCCICGCKEDIVLLEKAPGFPEAPTNIRCGNCGTHTDCVYKREDVRFTFFFIPLCRIKRGQPYLVCAGCHQSQGGESVCVCEACRTTYCLKFAHCPNCGARNTFKRVT